MEYLACYLAAVNILLCALMGTDKLLAKLQKRRIPEKTLFALAVLGGALGGTVGMYSFHHKTLTIVQIAAVAYVAYLVIK